jgi:phage terminase small subunit
MLKRKLTPKQLAFCEHYLACGNAAEAVRLAGYKTKNPDVIGSQLLSKAWLADYIAAHSLREQKLRILTAEERQHILSGIAASGTNADRIKAIETLNKMTGEYLNRVEVSGAVPTIIYDIPESL